MANAATGYPGFQAGQFKWYPQNLITPFTPVESGNVWFVDGDKSTGGSGTTWEDATATIGQAITNASAGDAIYVAAKTITAGATDPISYEETIVIPNVKSNLSLIGISRGRTQGGLPQLKDDTSTSPILSIRAPGCLITGLGFNGAGNTAGGIELNDNGSTNVAFGTTVTGCHFKNCKGTTSTDASTGGAIYWAVTGGGWQSYFGNNTFYKNTADICLIGTNSSRPQDIVIENNVFSGPAASVDANLYLQGGGSGINGVTINNNIFPVVDLPALGSGTVLRYIDATGCTGILSNNQFAFVADAAAKTFAAGGTGAFIPTTMRMTNNRGEADTVNHSGYIHRT